MEDTIKSTDVPVKADVVTTSNELTQLRAFKANAINLLETLHPIIKRSDYVTARAVYDFIVANKEPG